MKDTFRHFEMNHALQCVFPPMQYFACNCESYQESIGKGDKIGNEAYRWASARVFNSNKTSVGKAIAFGCATRCHLCVHSLVMPRSGPGGGGGRGVGGCWHACKCFLIAGRYTRSSNIKRYNTAVHLLNEHCTSLPCGHATEGNVLIAQSIRECMLVASYFCDLQVKN